MKVIKKVLLGMAVAISFTSLNIVKTVDVNAKEFSSSKGSITNISEFKNLLENNISSYFNSNVYALPSEIKNSDTISVIVSLDNSSLYDEYVKSNSNLTMAEFSSTCKGINAQSDIIDYVNKNIKLLKTSGIKYTLGEKYNTLLSGFEVEIKASDYNKLQKLYPTATLILGDVYEKCETQVVTNDVNVYDTGIFDSSSCQYQGDGVVVAVLDTGLDYTHSAFSVDNFHTSNEAFTLNYVKNKINQTKASEFTSGLTGEDVYLNKKVPYAYDYADKDSDVAPINSEHGTHVAGIIAGNDQTITGVAPNAQLAIFKVFSDHSDGAKTSWLIAALEDCVTMGVDIINMSLGSACGFTREVDKTNVNEIYDKVKDAGIELIASAANDYNATMGSEKNGNNPLTSNPDSGTVGSPSTYPGPLSVASVDGVKTSYFTVNDNIIFFNEASTNSANLEKSFVQDMLSTLGDGSTSHEFDYVVIPGVGRSSDYPMEDDYYKDKIVLVKRGTTTFEDKVRVALKEKGAQGIIIYNNVSGTISMSVGANIGAVCSVSQDDGEYLISQINSETGIGKLKISNTQLAGPFMSDFSSWGPTSDLKIKPEITAHGGKILSSVPGQSYERLSGTSMAAPNLSGAAALIYQYVKYSGVFGSDLSAVEISNISNQLMMSTADIIYDKNGLPCAVRKQGSGLISIDKAIASESYISTYDLNGKKMDKAKLELGDDKEKTGVYEMTFDINNVSSKKLSYNVDSIVLTEGVSKTYTSHGELTVTQNEYLLSGAKIEVINVNGGEYENNTVTVNANGTAKVSIRISLSDSDKKYLDNSFENGMYVEGFICLNGATEKLTSLNVPFLGFYGDWTKAPIFDEEYYDTNADEINLGIDQEDKLMADAYATRVIGGLYSDYITTLGTYYFVQNPNNTQIAASKDKIAVSNQNNGNSSTVSSIRSINAGLLRNVKELYVSIVDDSTGVEIYKDLVTNIHKSNSSGSTIYPASIDIDYDILEQKLKNNTRYTCTVSAYIDYGKNEDQKNLRNTFSFPFYVDFEAPIVTDVVYKTEYDRTTKKTKLYAEIYIYDNHYAMGAQVGQITRAPEGSEYTFSMQSFGKYITPVYSNFNSTSIITVELTDYLSQIANSSSIKYNSDGTTTIIDKTNTYIVNVYDYAMNSATYEIELPDSFNYLSFDNSDVKLSPNETLDLTTAIKAYPSSSWVQTLEYESSDDDIVKIVNNVLIAVKSGEASVTAKGYDKEGNLVTATMNVSVLSEGDEGYVKYSIPEINRFEITGYETIKAFYDVSSSEREIGVDGGKYDFDNSIVLSMFPSETVKLSYILDSYFPDLTEIVFKSSNDRIATIDDDGTIVAQAKGNTTIMVNVYYDGKATLYSQKVTIKVKEPYKFNSIYLNYYRGLGGVVEIPSDRGITTIYDYAFSNYKWVDKDLENGDVIDDEDPYYIKQQYIGENTITKIIIPEGVTTINKYAFANLTALEEVVLPKSLTRIGVGAFENCTSLKKINLENVKFINEKAFYNCPLEELNFASTVSIGNYAFANCNLQSIELPSCAQSLSEGAFANNTLLTNVVFKARKMKLGVKAFINCTKLTSINVNASVIPAYAFYGCEELNDVTLGSDVSVIGEYAFSGTAVEKFKLSPKNTYLSLENDGALVLSGTELVLVAPNYIEDGNKITSEAEVISKSAFAGNKKLFYLNLPNAKYIDDYAFAECINLRTVNMPNVEYVGKYAFYRTNLSTIGELNKLVEIGNYAFAYTAIETLNIKDDVNIGDYAFALSLSLKEVVLGNNVNVGKYAFFTPMNNYTYEKTNSFSHYDSYQYNVFDEQGNIVKTNYYYKYRFEDGVNTSLTKVVLGNNVYLAEAAFYGNGKLALVSNGENLNVGDYAFYSCNSLESINFNNISEIGNNAFSGLRTLDYFLDDNVWKYAYELKYIDGEFVNSANIYSCYAPRFEIVDLSNVEIVKDFAFAGNNYLTTVVLSSKMTEIGSYMFANCKSLKQIELGSHITKIGDYAFFSSGLENIDLSNVTTIGEAAFYNNNLSSIKLCDSVEISDYAFYLNRNLKNVDNSNNIKSIGAYAFSLVGLKEISLDNVCSIGDFAFSGSNLEYVSFGDKLEKLGENPFYNTKISSFGKRIDVIINGNKISTELDENYDLNDYVKVINGVLYYSVPKGLVLVSYPTLKQDKEFTIDNKTVRISATAFSQSVIESVTLSEVLSAIGDKAFYNCKNLRSVTFRSYTAPLFEEAFSESYASYENLPISGNFSTYTGLGISKYYMWNVASDKTNYYYGANFKDYIGKDTGDIIAVRPNNGQNYDSFIFKQYFGYIINGGLAKKIETINVIDLIASIPSNVTLNDEALVVSIRAMYELLSNEQKVLVENIETLEKAESTITYLKGAVEPEPDEPSIIVEDNGFVKFIKNNMVGLIISAVLLVVIVVLLVLLLKKNKQNKSLGIDSKQENAEKNTLNKDFEEKNSIENDSIDDDSSNDKE